MSDALSRVLALLIAVQGLFVAVSAAPLAGAPQGAAAEQAPGTYTLGVARDGIITTVSLNSEGARLSAIAANLSQRLGASIILGPAMKDAAIRENFSGLPLEQALTALAPRVLVDYEISQTAQPVAKGIYLLGFTDPEPAVNAVIRGISQGVFITGNTEDKPTAPADDPLLIVGDKNRLTLVTKQQPLPLVVMAVADVLGVPFEIEYDSPELVDANFRDAPAEEAVRTLSPNLRFYVRVDLSRSERTPLRLVVVRPDAR